MRAIVFDTNLLVLYIAGFLRPELIGTHRRLRQFDAYDFARVREFAIAAKQHFSTPNILTETSNLLDSGDQEITRGVGAALANYCGGLSELYFPSKEISRRVDFQKFGLADCALVELAQSRDVTVITSEYPLQGHLERLKLPSVNIFHLKTRRELS